MERATWQHGRDIAGFKDLGRGLLDGGGTGAVLLGSESTSETGEQGRLEGGGATPGESSSVTCSKEGIA